MAHCTACGHLIPNEARFCRSCGALQDIEMEQLSQPNTMAKPPSGAPNNSTFSNRNRKWLSNRKRLIGGGVALVAVVICTVLAIVNIPNKVPATSKTQQASNASPVTSVASPSPEVNVLPSTYVPYVDALPFTPPQDEPVSHGSYAGNEDDSLGEEITCSLHSTFNDDNKLIHDTRTFINRETSVLTIEFHFVADDWRYKRLPTPLAYTDACYYPFHVRLFDRYGAPLSDFGTKEVRVRELINPHYRMQFRINTRDAPYVYIVEFGMQ